MPLIHMRLIDSYQKMTKINRILIVRHCIPLHATSHLVGNRYTMKQTIPAQLK